jgi:hypothetical protein
LYVAHANLLQEVAAFILYNPVAATLLLKPR